MSASPWHRTRGWYALPVGLRGLAFLTPDENTYIPFASPGSLFAYQFGNLEFNVVDSGFVVD